MSEKRRQPKSGARSARGAQALMCLLLLALATLAPAIDTQKKDEATLGLPLTSSVTPLYLEKSSNPHSLNPEAGWQVGGLSTRFNTNLDAGALGFSGGYYYSRTLAPRTLLDPRDPMPSAQFGQDAAAQTGDMPAFLRLFQSSPAAKEEPSDRITFQRVSYKTAGLSLSGGFSEVGEEFQGLSAVVQGLQGSDPATAKGLALGTRTTDYSLGYTGVRGLNFNSSYNSVTREKQGDKEDGLTRTTFSNRMGLALGARHTLDYSVTSLTEAWDPSKKKKDTQVDTQALTLAGGLAQKSTFSLGQTTTSTLVGTQETEVTEQKLALKWNEWTKFGFGAQYTSKETAQTTEQIDTLALDINAPLSPLFTLTGKLTDGEITNAKQGTVKQSDLLDLKLVSQLTPTLKFTTQYKDAETPDAVLATQRTSQLAWAMTPRWTAHYLVSEEEHSKKGDTAKTAYGVTAEIGTKALPQQLSLTRYQDDLPNDLHQQRTELAYTRPLGAPGSPLTLQVRAGQFDFQQGEKADSKPLLAVQLLSAKAAKKTTLSLGYYDGPTVGTGHLTYRAWGLKPTGNLQGTWRAQDMTQYAEVGGEMVHALTPRTRLVMKEFQGQNEDDVQWQTTEYGVEQRIGTVRLLAGQRETVKPGKAGLDDIQEDWWQVAIPVKTKLPDWAANSLRASAFADGATWGFNQAAKWAAKPVAGLTYDQRDTLVGQKQVEASSLQYAGMWGSNLFVQASYERNPYKAGNANEVDALRRGLLHTAWALSPQVTVFARYQNEWWTEKDTTERSYTAGLVGTFSKTERLQLQTEQITRITRGLSRTGCAYVVQYERALNADNSFALKYRLNPEEFSSDKDRVRLEGSFRRAF